jgi:hypothetical protein
MTDRERNVWIVLDEINGGRPHSVWSSEEKAKKELARLDTDGYQIEKWKVDIEP